jgi:hypothetical protein
MSSSLPFYFLKVALITRKRGHRAMAKAAYNSGCRFMDLGTGEISDFSRKPGVVHFKMVVPSGCEWATDPEVFWSTVEAAEKRGNSRLGRDIVVGLPHLLSDAQQASLLREFAEYVCRNWGTALLEAKHRPSKNGDRRNDHGHLFSATRRVTPEGLGSKLRGLDNPRTSGPLLEELRATWAAMVNISLGKAGIKSRVDHRSYKRQSLEIEPGRPRGMALTSIARKLEEIDQKIVTLGPSMWDIEVAQRQLHEIFQMAPLGISPRKKDKSEESKARPLISVSPRGHIRMDGDFSFLVAFLIRRLKGRLRRGPLTAEDSALLAECGGFLSTFTLARMVFRGDRIHERGIDRSEKSSDGERSHNSPNNFL